MNHFCEVIIQLHNEKLCLNCPLPTTFSALRLELPAAAELPTMQLGLIYNIGDNLQIGRFSSSGDNFVSDSGDCLFIGRTDFHPKKRNGDAHYSLNLRALQLSFTDGDKKRWGQTRVFW